MHRLAATALVATLVSSPVLAEKHCAIFDQHTVGTAFPGPGAVLFKDDILEVRTAGFATGYGNTEVVSDNGIGVTQKVVFFNNSSFHLVSREPFSIADAQVQDHGGYEMVGAMGGFPTDIELHDKPTVVTPLARIDAGINSPDGVGRIHWETTTDQLLFSIVAGGQELSVGEICIETQ